LAYKPLTNTRFIRKPFEINLTTKWKPFIKGASGRCWFEGFYESINWHYKWNRNKICMNIDSHLAERINNEKYYFKKGIAFSMIGDRFSGAEHISIQAYFR
jgi:hypothetical protein